METLYLLEEVLGAKFKFEKLSKQFGCYDGSKFGFYEKVTGLKSAYCCRTLTGEVKWRRSGNIGRPASPERIESADSKSQFVDFQRPPPAGSSKLL